MKRVTIKAPFYGAGSPKQFNWVKDGYDIFGVGINIKHLKEYKELEIVVEGKPYQVKTQVIRDFVNKYNSLHKVKDSMTTVGVFSISLLKGFSVAEKEYCCPDMKNFGQHFGKCKNELEKKSDKEMPKGLF